MSIYMRSIVKISGAMVLLLASMVSEVEAQQHPLISQYMFNGIVLNPGYAGSKDYAVTALLYRKQWVGFDGSPETQTASIHGPLRNKKVGLGFTIMNDKIGVTNRTDFYGSYAYHVQLGKKSKKRKLSFGMQGGASYYRAKLSDLIVWDTDDPVFSENTQTNLLPNAGLGVYYYTRRFYAGFSVPHLVSYDPSKSLSVSVKDGAVPHQVRHYFLATGYVFEFSDVFKLKPSTLVKYVPNAPLEADLNVNMLFNNTLWVGGSYRTNDAVVAIIEFQISPQLRVGYSYDATQTDIKNHSDGSHEIMVGYDFGFDVTRKKTPRYF